MKSKVTHALLSRLSNTINNGQPIWGLLWANEYREELGAIYGVLIKKAQRKMEELGYEFCKIPNVESLIQQTLRGAKLSSLEFDARLVVQNFEQRENQSTRKVISVVGHRTRRKEIGLLSQNIYSQRSRLRKSLGRASEVRL